mmetsp:Transcript_26015/g.80074  ORF Transcript_26015/g.80074 Transcript_26015/m.80074 type:complete len:273 (-) Transcript_26015:362-1180(-)
MMQAKVCLTPQQVPPGGGPRTFSWCRLLYAAAVVVVGTGAIAAAILLLTAVVVRRRRRRCSLWPVLVATATPGHVVGVGSADAARASGGGEGLVEGAAHGVVGGFVGPGAGGVEGQGSDERHAEEVDRDGVGKLLRRFRQEGAHEEVDDEDAVGGVGAGDAEDVAGEATVEEAVAVVVFQGVHEDRNGGRRDHRERGSAFPQHFPAARRRVVDRHGHRDAALFQKARIVLLQNAVLDVVEALLKEAEHREAPVQPRPQPERVAELQVPEQRF